LKANRLRGIVTGKGGAVGERDGYCVGHLFSDVVTDVGADHQLKEDAAL
jgi:hypothetical protein